MKRMSSKLLLLELGSVLLAVLALTSNATGDTGSFIPAPISWGLIALGTPLPAAFVYELARRKLRSPA